MSIIDAVFNRARVVMLVFVMIIIAGVLAYIAIPKESEPDIPIPVFYVSIFHEGIAPKDAERLLLRPMEKELKSIEGLKEMRSVAGEGYASITLEFNAGFGSDKALLDVREKVDMAKSQLPPDTDEPSITEVNISLFPVLSIALSGLISEQELVSIARKLKNKLEAISGVLKADIGGDREEMMEVVIEPSVIEAYNLTFSDITNLLHKNNKLVAAGALDNGAGRMIIKIPGIIENIDDVLGFPVKVAGDTVVTFKDLVSIRRVFKDPVGFARISSNPAVVLEISKKLGSNIIEIIDNVRKTVEGERKNWPESLHVTFMQDKSVQINNMLTDLQNNILTAIILVIIVIIAFLGPRPAFLVGMAIPGSFLAGILIMYIMGITINIVVLFSLILVVGMLVDGAIVTIELADRKIAEGMKRKEAYAFASKRMAWPIIASNATTLAVFLPLIFWPGMVGEFMKYLPITVLITLIASLFMALIFIPVLGGLIGNKKVSNINAFDNIRMAESGNISEINGVTGAYLRLLKKCLHYPGKIFSLAFLLLILTYALYGKYGQGIEFFPKMEPDFIQVQVQARGDLSVYEKDELTKKVEKRLLDMGVFKAIYSRTIGNNSSQSNMPADVIGVIQLEFINWRLRPSASYIIEDVRARIAGIAGVKAQVRESESGPSSGKPVQIEIQSTNTNKLDIAVEEIKKTMGEIGNFVDVEDSRPIPGIEWRMQLNREQAAFYGADVTTIGNAVQMLTTGLKLAEYQPDDSDKELDIRLRFPDNHRSLEQLLQLRIPTIKGHIPLTNLMSFDVAQKTGNLNKINGNRVMIIKAGVAKGFLVDTQVKLLKEALDKNNFDPNVSVFFKGQDKDQKETGVFLIKAFFAALFLMITILLIQFNNFYQTILILSAIIFSTAGVLLGLLITGNPFGIVMGGIGLIALAGIVVNNNIVLIDTYNDLKNKEVEPMEAILRTAAQRMRPVLLTSVTTILGLLPMVFAMNIDLVGQDIAFGAPSTQLWVQLSSAIVGGLSFATLLTLVLTPCMLMIGETFSLKDKLISLFNFLKRRII
tara:strand:+ start:2896 stop:6042 length:3147 start_codon:yes stop_codon:yes gene_type:complete